MIGDCRDCGRRPGAALRQTQVVLVSSKTDPLQNAAEPTPVCGHLSEEVFKSKKHSWKREGGTKSEIQRTEEEKEQQLLSMLQIMEDSMLEQRDIS